MKTRELGRSGLVVFAIGLGRMGMSANYGWGPLNNSMHPVPPTT
jgi:aryl-alcohol dehydrogenase-like predicted oxidoreductase